jgi:anti-sigma factor RsiW
MSHPSPPFPDDPAHRRDPRTPHAPDAPDAPDEADRLMDLAAWLDGSLSPEDRDRVEARLAEDPHARALAISARLHPVTPEDLLEPLPAAVVARAAALRSAATDPPLVELRLGAADRGGHRGWTLAAFVRHSVAAAACLVAVLGGWRLGGFAARPEPRVAVIAAAGTPAASIDDRSLLAAASFGIFDTTEAATEDTLPLLAMLDGGSSLGLLGIDGGSGR